MPPKGQEMDDHYFGTLKEKVASFMKELNVELWKLGITAKTQHNEAAPAQHELAPIYDIANIATDHNQLIMEVMKKVANRHGMECLLHEKPFKGVNGSGKHNNWSMVTDTGENLFKPTKKPHENIRFLLFLSAILKAVDENAELLRYSASCPGNDHRLGGHEAPPAIISIFLGEQLEDILAQIKENGEATESIKGGKLNTGVHTLPALKKDAMDRNRTSPFAFTGNKFEFRTVGSSMSIADVNSVLNTIVAEALCEFADELEQATDFEAAVKELIAKTVRKHERIVFSGNGYSEEWVKEAERRGLPNIASMVESIPALVSENTVRIFEKHHVLSEAELHSRAEVSYEIYSKAINIEARTMVDMSAKQYIPAVIQYTTELANSINTIRQAVPGADVTVQTSMLSEISELLVTARAAQKTLEARIEEAAKKAPGKEQGLFFRMEVVPAMEALRAPIDTLEMLVAKKDWPVPSYGDLLFEQ
jgi:glutamine synthetase